MTERKPDPIRPTDAEARSLARDLIKDARYAALGVIDPATGAPMVTRIALVPGPDGVPLTLISELSSHTAALRANPACSLLIKSSVAAKCIGCVSTDISQRRNTIKRRFPKMCRFHSWA